MPKPILFTELELEALSSAGEEMVELVSSGRRWGNEPPETLTALKRATRKLLAERNKMWRVEATDAP